MTRIAIIAAGVALLTACTGEKQPEYPNPRPPAPQAAAPAPGAPAAPAPGAPAAAPAPEAPAAKVDITPEAQAEADTTFASYCSTCHGPQGAGDGPAAAAFPVKPRNFHDAEWQKSVTDAHIAQTIVQGGAAVGKSPLMPANPQLADKQAVVAALVQKIRGFGKAQ